MVAPPDRADHNLAGISAMELLWWHWLVVGLLLVVAELLSPGGFYIIFFGVGAVTVGLLSLVGLAGPGWMQLLLFAGVSVGGLLFFRSRILRWLQGDPNRPQVDALVGEIGHASEDLAPGAVGRVEFRGSAWSARNASGVVLPRGARCRVVRVEGLMLFVEPEGAR
jgi:membrane protein implicated in regulation of membrane protease activity